MKRTHRLVVTACTLMLASVAFGQVQQLGQSVGGSQRKFSPMEKKLQRRWIVRSVVRDGKPNAAQIGQKVGDVITVKASGNQLALG